MKKPDKKVNIYTLYLEELYDRDVMWCHYTMVCIMFLICQKSEQESHLSASSKVTSVHTDDSLQKNNVEAYNLNTWIPTIVSNPNVQGCGVEVTVHHPLNCHASRVADLQSRISLNGKESLKPTDFGIDDIPFIDDDQMFVSE